MAHRSVPDLAAITAALEPDGLVLRGGFAFADGDEAPEGLDGRPARAVVLVGNVGAAFWPHFERWRAGQAPGLPDPLDSWSRQRIGAVAERFGARAVSPSDRPYLPCQQWAMRAEGLRPSPLGILMHPVYGLWHAYRGALLFDRLPIGLTAEVAAQLHQCGLCAGKYCLRRCPVAAHGEDGLAYSACLDHLHSADDASCMTGGCLDRNACPHGAAYRYPLDLQAFLMAAFRG